MQRSLVDGFQNGRLFRMAALGMADPNPYHFHPSAFHKTCLP